MITIIVPAWLVYAVVGTMTVTGVSILFALAWVLRDIKTDKPQEKS